ncbi:hypothetical protein [Actinoplanes sp. NPDC089786]|uniref:hypothetical protein n=1 Tax=Actinoplanes sp. NPDC089786 TaxID=3155185 RepID=UPI003429CDA6
MDTWHGGEVSEAQAGFREQLVARVLRADPMIWPYRVIPFDRGGAQDASPQAV